MINSYYLKIKFDDFSLIVATEPEYTPNVLTTHSHFHPTCEFHLISRGETILRDEKTSYKANSGKMIIVPPMHYHSVENANNTVKFAFSVKITSKEAKSGLYKKISNLLVKQHITVMDFGNIPELLEIIEICTKPAFYSKKETEYLLKSYFTIFFLKLATFSELIESPSIKENYTESILAFIFENFSSNITLGDLAKKLNLSVRHTEKLIKERLNTTFTSLLNEYRVNMAKEQIKKEECVLLENVAYNVGFYNYSHFYKSFVKYTGVSPSIYKSNHSAK